MMYIFPNKIKKIAIAFMIVGFFGLAYGFLSAPKTIEESKAMIEANHGDHHGAEHDEDNLKSHRTLTIIEGSENLFFFVIMFILIFFTHRENIKRLKNKEETKTKIY